MKENLLVLEVQISSASGELQEFNFNFNFTLFSTSIFSYMI